MKLPKSELIYLITSIIVLAFAGVVYLVVGRNNGQVEVSQVQTKTSSSSNATSTSESNTVVAEQALTKYEADKTDENYNQAKAEIDKLEDGDAKTKLQERLKEARAQQTAEAAVTKLEEDPTLANLEAAEKAVAKVTDAVVQKALNDRIDAIRAQVEDSSEEAESVAETAASETASVAVTDNNVSSQTTDNYVTPAYNYNQNNSNNYNDNSGYYGQDVEQSGYNAYSE